MVAVNDTVTIESVSENLFNPKSWSIAYTKSNREVKTIDQHSHSLKAEALAKVTYVAEVKEENDREKSITVHIKSIHGLYLMSSLWAVKLVPFVLWFEISMGNVSRKCRH